LRGFRSITENGFTTIEEDIMATGASHVPATYSEAMPLSALAHPPRFVPLSLRLGSWFGGFHNQFGWMFFGFGMILYWVFALHADYESVYFLGDLETAPGFVTGSEKLNFKVNKQYVYEVRYRFTAGGTQREATSYITAHSEKAKKKAGAKVTIEYPAGNPERSRIQGGGNAPMPIWCLFVGIFPLIGLAFLTFGLRDGRRTARLMANGESAVGTFVRKEETNVRINKRNVYRYIYEFPAADGNVYEATASTHNTELLAANEQPLLYDPANAANATLVAHLPYRPEVDGVGQFKPVSPRRLALTMFLPTASILGHGGFLCWRLFSSVA
jgi:hypothetical protein